MEEYQKMAETINSLSVADYEKFREELFAAGISRTILSNARKGLNLRMKNACVIIGILKKYTLITNH